MSFMSRFARAPFNQDPTKQEPDNDGLPGHERAVARAQRGTDREPVLERVLLHTMTRDNESRRRFIKRRWRSHATG
jgi:hypothetical protein